jgi:hypothetical protein
VGWRPRARAHPFREPAHFGIERHVPLGIEKRAGRLPATACSVDMTTMGIGDLASVYHDRNDDTRVGALPTRVRHARLC